MVRESRPDLGSSPLARGLPRSTRPCGRRNRIIPARAGFTSRRLSRASRMAGSSPLARGLLEIPDLGQKRGRIIPARAGFTRSETRKQCSPADHPRSRGVYSDPSWPVTRAIGSSPLARGLRGRESAAADRERIIPARAGFTTVSDRPHTKLGDHPRSRGVYATTIWTAVMMPGSSPLARGLRGTTPSGRRRRRIIPARAGFTSRGSMTPLSLEGSSPLARGLQGHRAALNGKIRIIPARAGFTVVGFWQDCRGRDHPRSRGVYSFQGDGRDGEDGSSPLARGLRPAP